MFELPHTTSPTLAFPGASLGREGGLGGGGGGLLAASGVAGRAGEEEPVDQGDVIIITFCKGERVSCIKAICYDEHKKVQHKYIHYKGIIAC